MSASPPVRPPLLDLETLSTLVAIADSGNFSAAAERVFRTPSAVSMQVKKLEGVLGRTLFRRDSRSVVATPDGERLVQHARRMLALNQQVIAEFVAPDVAGRVRLGAPDDLVERALPDVLKRFSHTHACVTVDVVVDQSSNLMKRVRQGELDLTIVTCNPHKPLERGVEKIFQEKLTWAGARNGVAFECRPLPISVWEEGCSWRNSGIESLQSAGIDFRIAFMSAHLAGQRAAMLADLAIAPVPLSACDNRIIPLGETDGLPPLDDCALGLLVCEKASKPVWAAADHLRAVFATCPSLKAV